MFNNWWQQNPKKILDEQVENVETNIFVMSCSYINIIAVEKTAQQQS